MRFRRFLRTLLLRVAAWLDESSPTPPHVSGPPPHWLERVRQAQFVSSEDGPVVPLPPAVRDVPRVGVPRVVARAPLPVARAMAPMALTPAAAHVPHPAVNASVAARSVVEASVPPRSIATRSPAPSAASRSAGPRSAAFQAAATPASSRPEGGRRLAGRSAGAPPAGSPRSAGEAPAERPPGRRPHIEDAPGVALRWPELPAGSRRSGRLEAGAPQSGAAHGGSAYGAPAAGRPVHRPLAGGPGGPPGDLRASGRRAEGTEGAQDTVNLWPELPDDSDLIVSLDDDDHLRRIDAEQRGAAWNE